MGIEKRSLIDGATDCCGVKIISGRVKPMLGEVVKDLCFQLKGELDDFVAILGAEVKGNPQLAVVMSENLVNERKLNAVAIIKEARNNFV